MEELNIVSLIEHNPIIKLTPDYNNKLLVKMKNTFTESQQQLFVASFYCFLNYDSKKDFVVDLDNIWNWLGFSTKQKAKVLLEKNFTIDLDYKLLNLQVKQTTHTKGGHNKETFMLTIKTFKSFCLKAGTKKADEIHDYYMKMEEMLQEVVNEETSELKKQLEKKEEQIENQVTQFQKEKEKLLEATLLLQFPVNTQCIYYGKIDNKTLGNPNSKMYNEDLIKFGQSNDLSNRILSHKKNFTNFRLIAAFKVKNKIEIENAIKRHPILKKQIRSTMIDDINYRELLAIDTDKFTIEKINDYFKEIIQENEYNIENYNLLLKKNDDLENELRKKEIELIESNKYTIKIKQELEKYTNDITNYTKDKISSNYAICKYGYFLYAFGENMRYKCSITRQKDFEKLTANLKDLEPNGEMRYYCKVSYPFSEKIMMFLLKKSFTLLGNNKFEGPLEDIQKIMDITVKLENLLDNNNFEQIYSILEGNKIHILENDPEVPIVRKAKRSIDQINPESGQVIATYESIEAAGRSLGLTTGTAIGISVREKKICKGFLWRYSGISKEDQFMNQPVIKICCSTGDKLHFTSISDAAKDALVSAPALRQRILTNVHVFGHHWIFDKLSTHYHS